MPPPPRRRRGPRRSAGSAYGGTPLALPLVATVAATAVTDTSADLIGSFNPQGLSGSWWFDYGTTPQFGTSTAPLSVGATAVPQTVQATVTGLATGSEYWFALVGQTAGGTVQAFPLSFIAELPPVIVTATQPVLPAGTPAVAIPHFQFPFAIDPTTGARVVAQDSYEEILACVTAIAVCPVGSCPELPSFGIPDLAFEPGPPDTTALTAALELWEPRARQSATLLADDGTQADWTVALTGRAAGTGQ